MQTTTQSEYTSFIKKLFVQFMALASIIAMSLSGAHAHGNQSPHVVIATNYGDITVELNGEAAPKTVTNFLQYVNSGYYNGTIFHRVINDFMIQGGGFTENMQRKETSDPIKNEADNGLKNDKGTIAMARTSDPHSATAQFFINVKDNDFLNHTNKGSGWGYTVFGKVISGMDVVETIEAVSTGNQKGMPNVPTKPVVIQSITMTE